MRRRVYLTLAVVCGAAAAGAGTLWVWSAFRVLGVVADEHHVHIESGIISYGFQTRPFGSTEWEFYDDRLPEPDGTFSIFAMFPPGWNDTVVGGPDWKHPLGDGWVGFRLAINRIPWFRSWYASVPLWFVTLLFGLLCWAFVAAVRRNPRFRSGHCPACGYDLRAGHERCPECGASTAAGADSRPRAAAAEQSPAVQTGGRP